jgi:integrase/recombinase XerD
MAKLGIKKRTQFNVRTIHFAEMEVLAEKTAIQTSASTMRNYTQSLGYFLNYLEDMGFENVEDLPVEHIDSSMIAAWSNTMMRSGKKATTANHYLRDVRSFLYWCMDKEYIKRFKISLIKGQEPELKAFLKEDIAVLLQKPHQNASFVEWRTWAIVNWVLGTGNRSSTVINIKLEDIDFITKKVFLRHTKNKKYQTTILSEATETAIKEYLNRWGIDEWLFPSSMGANEQLTANALRHSFARYCHERGIEQTNIHGLRHSFSELMVKNGASPFTLQQALGHTSITMSEKYVNRYTEDLAVDFKRYNPLDSLKQSSRRTQKIQKK